MMTRKHYNAIAAALRSGKASQNTIRDIRLVLLWNNPNFDSILFVTKATKGPTMEQRYARAKARWSKRP